MSWPLISPNPSDVHEPHYRGTLLHGAPGVVLDVAPPWVRLGRVKANAQKTRTGEIGILKMPRRAHQCQYLLIITNLIDEQINFSLRILDCCELVNRENLFFTACLNNQLESIVVWKREPRANPRHR